MGSSEEQTPAVNVEERASKGEPKHWLEYAIFGFVVLTFCATAAAAWYTRNQWITTDDVEKRSLRAYVDVWDVKINCVSCDSPLPEVLTGMGKGSADAMFVHIRNGGQTPARELTAYTNWFLVPYGENLPKDFAYPDRGPNNPDSRSSLPPTGISISFRPFGMVDVAAFVMARQHKYTMLVYGHVTYQDIFGKDWETLFCFRYSPDNAVGQQFPMCEEHNQSK